MAYVTPCLPATLPPVTCQATRWYGIPRGRETRNGYPIKGIMLHCLGMSLSEYTSRLCGYDQQPQLNPHASMHYVVSMEGTLTQFVADEDIAWGVNTYVGNFVTTSVPNAPSVYLGWPQLAQEFPNTTVDAYVLHIGIAVAPSTKVNPGCADPCDMPPLGMEPQAYRKLVRLVAYLAAMYGIPVDSQHIAFHEQVMATTPPTECPCLENLCFICDVGEYCESCTNPFDASFQPSPSIKYIYGDNEFGCKVKISLEDLKTLLGL